ncbi:MAG: 1,4-dihydroxy-2-naphthoate polyprenyltransferase [Ardenticatenales bacterium]
MTPLRTWLLAIRPKTLVAAVAPVVVGTALAYNRHAFAPVAALAALAGALLIQIGTNLTNDVLDHRRGADTAERLGPTRVTQAGLLAPRSVALGAAVAFALAVAAGAYLVAVAGWPIAVLGVVAILSGIAYTAGPAPLAYVGLGDVFVMVFFGIAAVGGTYYVQVMDALGTFDRWEALHAMPQALLLGVGVGALATAILTVNNLRDRETDAVVGKRTLAVRMGDERTRRYFDALIFTAFALPVGLAVFHGLGPAIVAVLLAVPFALPPGRSVAGGVRGKALNAVLGQVARLQIVYAFWLSIGLIADRLLLAWVAGF